uniref:Transmembrane protein 216 n=1 Tax=Eptatretus burgeri TaxID=7764 RepID=A0A8C4QUA0_EPTBU
MFAGQVLPYPSSNLALDVLLLFLLLGIEISRIYFAWKGNLTERGVPLTLALGLVVPCVLLSVYLLLWQTYVLRAEVIISSILLVFLGLEAVLSCLAIATFAK